MRRFIVIYSKGRAIGGGYSTNLERQPGRHQLEVVAADRVDAFGKAIQHFQRVGLSTCMARDAQGDSFLGLPDEMIAARLAECGVEFDPKFANGIIVEKIVTEL